MVNPYFKSNFFDNEMNLLADLTDEAIYTTGIEVEYLPRKIVQHDPIMNEPLSSQFNEVYQIDMAIESTESFFAGNESISSIGLAFSFASSSLSVSRRKFTSVTGMQEPLNGDLIFIKQNQMLFEIVNTNVRDPLISGGRHFTFTIFVKPFSIGEGNSSFKESKFKGSRDLQETLSNFLGVVDQKEWDFLDASVDSVTADNNVLRVDVEESGLSQIVRADSETFTADCELTADDLLGVWNNSIDDVMRTMDQKIPNFSDNGEFECVEEKILVDKTNPFGFF
ncbi:neck protein [Agrobacterium phage Atu_ph04]|uniref:Neck protein n=1 Tax=Agrobacterium phage Atu_ph04 TaxID=2024263 RepID=A0A223VZU2_9CAUD|nr:head closure Hc2 [Agrobacterium phage Atu_ph04]ASV44685.1 neck protein [Agrobacterium phage Atu_ph04]